MPETTPSSKPLTDAEIAAQAARPELNDLLAKLYKMAVEDKDWEEEYARDLILIFANTYHALRVIEESRQPSIYQFSKEQFCAIWPEREKGWTVRAMEAYRKLLNGVEESRQPE